MTRATPGGTPCGPGAARQAAICGHVTRLLLFFETVQEIETQIIQNQDVALVHGPHRVFSIRAVRRVFEGLIKSGQGEVAGGTEPESGFRPDGAADGCFTGSQLARYQQMLYAVG